MKKVPVVEYDEEGNRTVIGEADVEVELKDGQIVVKQAVIDTDSELAKRFEIKSDDFSIGNQS